MGRYLFYNNSVAVALEGGVEIMALEGPAVSDMASDPQAHILIVETDGPAMIERVRMVRRIFPKNAIRTLTSYAVALRAFLVKGGLISKGEDVIVADNIGGKFLLTALMSAQGAFTRVIAVDDPAKVAAELRRTQKNALERPQAGRRASAWRILSNDQGLLDALDPEQQRNAVFFEDEFPVFDLLGEVLFPAQLMTPEDVVIQRRAEDRQRFISAGLFSLVIAGAGIGSFVFAKTQARFSDERLGVLKQEKVRLEKEAQMLSVLTFQPRLRALPQAVYLKVMDAFSAGIPPGGHIDEVLFTRGSAQGWSFTGRMVFPGQELLPFTGRGPLKDAESRHIFIEGRQGLRIKKDLI